jgi:hypothetical protein
MPFSRKAIKLRILSYLRSLFLDKALIYGTHRRSSICDGDIVADLNLWINTSRISTLYQIEILPYLSGGNRYSVLYIFDENGQLVHYSRSLVQELVLCIDFSNIPDLSSSSEYGTFVHFVEFDSISSPLNVFPHYSGYTTYVNYDSSFSVHHGSHGYIRIRPSSPFHEFHHLTQVRHRPQSFLSCAYKCVGVNYNCVILNSSSLALEFQLSIGKNFLSKVVVPSLGARSVPISGQLEGQVCLSSRSTFIRPIIHVVDQESNILECFHT